MLKNFLNACLALENILLAHFPRTLSKTCNYFSSVLISQGVFSLLCLHLVACLLVCLVQSGPTSFCQ